MENVESTKVATTFDVLHSFVEKLRYLWNDLTKKDQRVKFGLVRNKLDISKRLKFLQN